MRNDKFLKGIQIIMDRMPEEQKEGSDLCAEHDQIWFGDEDWVTDPLDIKTLDGLGWFVDQGGWSCFA